MSTCEFIEVNEELKAAVLKGELNKVKVLISQGADIDYRIDSHHSTLLHCSLPLEITRTLLQNGADVNARDRYGQTPLCCAVARRALEVVKLLISFGAEVNVKMIRGNTPLHYAPTVEITEELLNHSADVNATDSYGRTPLHSALIEKKRISVFRTLLSAGADINVRMGLHSNTLLHYADSLEITRELLSHGADVNAITINRQRPLHYAVKHMKEVAVVREILQHGANVNATDNEGNSALVYAIRSHRRNSDVIKVLVEYKGDINIQCFDYSMFRFWTPLDSAIHHDMACAQLILKLSLLVNFEHVQINVYLGLIRTLTNPNNLINVSPFLDECVSEILKMKDEKIRNNLTLFDMVAKRGNHVKPMYRSYRDLDAELFAKYPIFHDIIMPVITLYLERGRLLDKVKSLKFSTRSNNIGTEVALFPDCLEMIAEYLSDQDLWNLLSSSQ